MVALTRTRLHPDVLEIMFLPGAWFKPHQESSVTKLGTRHFQFALGAAAIKVLKDF